MRKIGPDIEKTVRALAGNSEQARINMRVKQVLDRYKKAIQVVYRESADLHLAHTNKVIIMNKEGVRTLIVYVDDSLFAAELNAQRELIKLHLLELFGEEIDDFRIMTSRWQRFREIHPYIDDVEDDSNEKSASVPLNDEEKSFVSDTVSAIEDKKLRESLMKAMTADLEWKKGEKVKESSENAK